MMENEYICEECGRGFDTENGLSTHKGHAHDPQWQDEETLRELYVDEGLSLGAIAEKLGCVEQVVHSHMKKHGIPRREAKQSKPCHFRTETTGYEVWNTTVFGDQYTVLVHRLLAVAEFGFDDLAGKHVHHRKPIPWLNTPDNIELLEPSEHSSLHMKEHAHLLEFDGDGDISGWSK